MRAKRWYVEVSSKEDGKGHIYIEQRSFIYVMQGKCVNFFPDFLTSLQETALSLLFA